jgi:hypothetical protein
LDDQALAIAVIAGIFALFSVSLARAGQDTLFTVERKEVRNPTGERRTHAIVYFIDRQQMDFGETPHVRFALDRGARPFSGRAFSLR